MKAVTKIAITSSLAAATALFMSACMGESPSANNEGSSAKTFSDTYSWNGKKTIDGGVYYPIVGDKTGPYYVNKEAVEATAKMDYEGKKPVITFADDAIKYNKGRPVTKAELAAWNTDVTPTSPPPPGKGTVEEGEEVYEQYCIMCHGDFGSGAAGEAGIYPALSKGNAYELQKTLTNQRLTDVDDGPVRVFGSYWPEASTLWWYIKDGMPHPKTKSLTNDQVYALVAYILNLSEMQIDGEDVDEDYVLDQEKFTHIKMPNWDGFVPNIRGMGALDDVRAFYHDPKQYGGIRLTDISTRCMENCQKPTAKVTYIQGPGISEFLPPMSVKRDLPPKKEVASFDAKKAYEENCAMCHSTGAAPEPGDKAAWKPILAQGMDKVYKNAIKGTDAGMPAKGGSSLTDDQVKAVVDWIVNQSK